MGGKPPTGSRGGAQMGGSGEGSPLPGKVYKQIGEK